ncbi:MAG: glycosyltransferase family 4 protein [Eudoraea sp.]|nr:glycosyltransferase family 4 protein [Eudoraea sp.]
MSVPVNKHDAYGLYLLTANTAGIPVVQPATGAFPEIVEATGGGLVYQPDDSLTLATNIKRLLKDHKLRKELGQTGRKNVAEKFSLETMAGRIRKVYEGS